MNINDVADLINNMYIKIFPVSGHHPFLTDMDRVIKHNERRQKYLEGDFESDEIIPYIGHLRMPEPSNGCAKKYILLDDNTINKIYELMKKVGSYEELVKFLEIASYYSIPSTVKSSLSSLLNKFQSEKKLNILIIGGGPQGLFLASYINRIYGSRMGLQSSTPINLLVIDNRKEKEKVRKPYERMRYFYFSSTYFSFLFPRIYSWDFSEKESKFIPINQLELILYINCYKSGIPIYFSDDYETLDDYKEVINNGNFDIVFDCTGKRLKYNIPIDKSWFTESPISKRKKNYKVVENLTKNKVSLEDTSTGIPKHKYYIEISIFKLNKDSLCRMKNKFDININTQKEYQYFSTFNGKNFYPIANMNKVGENIETLSERTLFSEYYRLNKNSTNTYFKVTFFSTDIKHAIKVSHVMDIGNKKVLYIGAGDTIFRGHFVTGAGLNRTIEFSVKCANMLPIIDSIREKNGNSI